MAHEIKTTDEFEEHSETEEFFLCSDGWERNCVRPKGESMGDGCYWVGRSAEDQWL